MAATPIPPRRPTLLASVQWLLLALLALLTVGDEKSRVVSFDGEEFEEKDSADKVA